jgi:hypothetical protein
LRLVDFERPVWALGNKAKAGRSVWPALGIFDESRRGPAGGETKGTL